MIHVLASIKIKTCQRSAFLEIFKSNIPAVLRENGCISYTPTIDFPTGLAPQSLDDSIVTIIEKWKSLEELMAHLSAPHMLSYREKVKNMVEQVTLKILTEA